MTDLASTLRVALLVTGKDLRQRLRDRSVWLLAVVAPLALSAVLGQVVGGFTDRVLDPPRWGLVAAPGPAGAGLADLVLGPAAEELGASVLPLRDRAAAVAALEAEEVDAAVVLPDDLDRQLQARQRPQVEVLARPGAPVAAATLEAVVERWAVEVDVRGAGAVLALAAGADPAEVAARVATIQVPTTFDVVTLADQDRVLDGPTYVAAGLAVFFLFFSVQFGVLGVLEERQAGTLQRLRAAPVTGGSIMLGKLLTSAVIGLGSVLVLLAATTVLLDASWGPTLPVVVLCVAATAAAVSLVSVVAALAETPDAAGNIQSVIAIVLGMLGGAFFPVATEPGLLATLSDLTPHGMFLTGVGDLAAPGAGLADIGQQLAGLLAFAGASAVGARALARARGTL